MNPARLLPCALALFALLAVSAAAGGGADGSEALTGDAGRQAPEAADAPAQGRTSADWDTVKGGAVTVSGKVRLVGTATFSSLVISDAAGRDWYIAEADRPALKGYEQREVTVRGVVERKPMTLANGKKLEDRRVLRGISVLE